MASFLVFTQTRDGIDAHSLVASDLAAAEAAVAGFLSNCFATGLPLYNGNPDLSIAAKQAASTLPAGMNDGDVLIGIVELDGSAKAASGVATSATPVTGWTDNHHWRPLIKSADQTVTNSAALISDSDLAFTAAATTKYTIRGVIYYDTTAAGDFKYGFVGPTPTGVRAMRTHAIAGAAPTLNAVDTALPTGIALVGTGTTGGYIEFSMLFWNGATPGAFALQFAQNTATADTGAIVRAGSYIEYAKL